MCPMSIAVAIVEITSVRTDSPRDEPSNILCRERMNLARTALTLMSLQLDCAPVPRRVNADSEDNEDFNVWADRCLVWAGYWFSIVAPSVQYFFGCFAGVAVPYGGRYP